MKDFEYFVKIGDVKKSSVNEELAKSLVKDMEERIKKTNLLDLENFAKIIFENFYDALRDFADALLALGGFKSYSHQASISFLKKHGFDNLIIEEFETFRYKLNSSKYYGGIIVAEDAKDIKEFYNRIKPNIDKIVGGLNEV